MHRPANFAGHFFAIYGITDNYNVYEYRKEYRIEI
jgi:hypothetical protein